MINTMSRARREDGFTLIELLIVIVVLGILASIVLFAVGNTKGDAQKASTDTTKGICATASSASALTGSPMSSYVSDSSKC